MSRVSQSAFCLSVPPLKNSGGLHCFFKATLRMSRLRPGCNHSCWNPAIPLIEIWRLGQCIMRERPLLSGEYRGKLICAVVNRLPHLESMSIAATSTRPIGLL
jgi:hypothetical protein